MCRGFMLVINRQKGARKQVTGVLPGNCSKEKMVGRRVVTFFYLLLHIEKHPAY